MDVEDKQRSAIEFLLLEGHAGREIVICLWKVYGSGVHCRTSVFRRVSETCPSNEELRNKGHPRRSYQHDTDAAIQ
jgi:hypothetical protein